MERILIIDDDQRLSEMLSEYLQNRGFEVAAHGDAASGMAALRRTPFDAVILDVMLPDLDGFDVCKGIRAELSVPIIMLTARGDEYDRIVGLELGADDYLPKPFNPRELLARLRAVLRRKAIPPGESKSVLRFGNLEIDRGARRASLDGQPCTLTSYQFELLRVLAENAGRAMTREELMDRVRGDPAQAFDRSIDVHISRIRAAIEEDVKNPRRILTIRGVGYLFAEGQADEVAG
jgi:DNA-binding response OmpR family regulator